MASETQTVIFSKGEGDWDVTKAKSWLREHGFKSGDTDETESSWRFRQFNPSRCKEGSYKTLTENTPAGVSIVVCETDSAGMCQMRNQEMPAVLESCVRHVMAKGHSESSAFAICRTSLGLMTDGSEDEREPHVTDEQMKSRIEIAMRFQQGPTLIKEISLCNAVGAFINGEQRGVLSRKRLAAIAKNFNEYPRPVPIFLAPDHPESNDQLPPVGWVESVRMSGDDLMGRVKLFGAGAEAIGGDLIRLGSIYTVQGRDYDGTAIGEVLKHFLLSNESYIKNRNIAAAHFQGEEPVACFTTALKMEGEMPDDKDKEKEIEELKARIAELEDQIKEMEKDKPKESELTAAQSLLQAKIGEVAELTAANENLRAEVGKFKGQVPSKALEEVQSQLRQEKRKTLAAEIRRKVAKGVARGQFNHAFIGGDPEGSYENESDETVLAWFKSHPKFLGSIEKLDTCLAVLPEVRSLGRTFPGGTIGEGKEAGYTESQKESIRKLGQDVDEVVAATQAKDSGEFMKLQGKKAS